MTMAVAVEPIAKLSERMDYLEGSAVTLQEAYVLDVHPDTNTFDADLMDAGRLDGISAPAHFLPAIGDWITLELHGTIPIYQPVRIGAGAIGEDELATEVTESIATAYATANGKNQVRFSALTPTAAGVVGAKAGDLWFQEDIFGAGLIVSAWEWNGTSWVSRTFNDSVLASLTVGKIVGGTGVFNMLMAGSIYSATSGSRYLIDGTGIKLYTGSSTTPTVDLNAVTGNATFRGIVEGALIRTSSAGQRLEIQSGSRAITFYPAGAGGSASFFSADDGSGNAGVTARAGTTAGKYGFLNFTSTFADMGYWEGASATAYVRANPATSTFGVEISTGKDIALTTPRVRWFSGAATYASLSIADGLGRISKFSLNGPADLGGAGTGANFTFGFAPGASDADVYALRFISTNPGSTGGFVYFSDRRLKKNIREATAFAALEEVMATPIRQFEWRETGETGVGFVAQDVPADAQVALSPDFKVKGAPNPIGISSEQLVVKLWKAVQELGALVKEYGKDK